MSRMSRSDAYMRIWIKFSALPQPENRLIELENDIRGIIEKHGHHVYSLEFRVKDDRAIPEQD